MDISQHDILIKDAHGNDIVNSVDRVSVMVHHTMAIVGGFMGCYAVLLRADFLGNAQTSNLLYVLLARFGGNLGEFLIRMGAVLIYAVSVIMFAVIKNKLTVNIKYISLGIDALAICALAFIPKNVDPIIGLYPIFFAMAFQWNAFSGHYGYNSSTIFSTNNLRQVSLAIGEYICNGDRKHLHKAKFFLGSLIGFHLGAAFAYVCVLNYSVQAIWFNLFPVFVGLLLEIHLQKIDCRNN